MEKGSLLETEVNAVARVILDFNKKFNETSDAEAFKLDAYINNIKDKKEDLSVFINEFNNIKQSFAKIDELLTAIMEAE